jgi:hypothetical protein
MRVSGSLILVIGLMGSAYADGDTLGDMMGPREIAVGEAMRGAATGASAIGLNPAGLPLTRELVFEGGYGYRPSDSASLIGVSACDSTVTTPGCFYYSYAGSSPELSGMEAHRRTHVVGTSFGYPVTPRVFIGSSVRYVNYKDDAMPMNNIKGFNWDVGTTIRLTDFVNIGSAVYNVYGADSPEMPRAVGTGIVAKPVPILAISFDARWKLLDNDHSARYGGGAELFLKSSSGQTGFPLRVGALHDNGLGATYLSAGLGLSTMQGSVDIAARRAISGVDETIVLASVRVYGPRMAAPSPADPIAQ